MKTTILILSMLAVTACSRPETQPPVGNQASLQCAKDTDCKGDRICEAGVCESPANSTQVINPAIATVDSTHPAGSESSNIQAVLEDTLITALRQKSGTDERMGDYVKAIIDYANAGYVNKRPDSRFDYSDFRRLLKPADFMGHVLVVIEEEYMQQYVGCCVSPGISVTLRLKSNGNDLDAFAKRNGCSISRDTEDLFTAPPHIPDAPIGTYATLECKERDLADSN